MDVGAIGRMAILTDPSGARVRALAGRDDHRRGPGQQAGGLVWEDLRSTDPDAARSFYGALFGYEYEALEMAGPDYATFKLPTEPHTCSAGQGRAHGPAGGHPEPLARLLLGR